MASTATRKLLDQSFAGFGIMSIVLMAASLLIILAPMFVKGMGAYLFQGTVEHRKVIWDLFEEGNKASLDSELAQIAVARQPVYDIVARFERELAVMPDANRRKYSADLKDLKKALRELLGPIPGEGKNMLIRQHYGQTRWDRAQVKLNKFLFIEEYDYSNPTKAGIQKWIPRAARFMGTSIEPLFPYVRDNLEKMLLPRWTFYGGFLTHASHDSHFFGGIWPEVLGTLYLTIGAMFFAAPIGVISAIYLVEYARENSLIRILRSCISTLAGVPSIVFGLFGLAFFINEIHLSKSKSVLAGALTLGLLVLPTIIRASEEALRAVPATYKQAALSLGAGMGRAIITVILPAALPGILTGIVISMGRAAGETAPIIFTAAVSVGKPLTLLQTLTQPTPALPWNIYNLCTEHEAVDEIRHVQYGMVFTLVMLVLILNTTAIVLRARLSKKLRV